MLLDRVLPARDATSKISSPVVYRWTISLTRGWHRDANFPVLREPSVFYRRVLVLWTLWEKLVISSSLRL